LTRKSVPGRIPQLVEHRTLGKDGPEVPVLGLGAWPLGGGMGHVDERAAIATIHAAIEHGITLIDTAQGYRTSEATLGKALRGGYRERVFLATKVSDASAGGFSRRRIESALENSLRALQVEVIDLYQIHFWDDQTPISETMETLAGLQAEGKIRYFGVSNFTVDQMKQALETAHVQANQLPYNLFDRWIEGGEIDTCEQAGIGILAHSALAKGLLAGKYTPDWTFPADDERSHADIFPQFHGARFQQYLAAAEQLKAIARDKGLTLLQLAIAWTLRLPAITCALVGAKTPEQIEDYLGAVGVTFGEDELAQIRAIIANTPTERWY
jgi:aryl-alcohol dehydrogenase-like predicted oxidoreductase